MADNEELQEQVESLVSESEIQNQTGEETQPAAEVVTETPAAKPELTDEQKGLTAALTAERDKRQQAEAEARILREMMNKTAEAKPPIDPMSDIEDDCVLEGRQFKQVVTEMRQQFGQVIADLSIRAQFPDYEQVVGVPGQLGEPLLKLIKEEPDLARIIILSAPNPQLAKLAAYKMAKRFQSEPQREPVKDRAAQAAVKVANATRPISSAALGGGAGLSAANRFANMSDEELAAEEARVLGQ